MKTEAQTANSRKNTVMIDDDGVMVDDLLHIDITVRYKTDTLFDTHIPGDSLDMPIIVDCDPINDDWDTIQCKLIISRAMQDMLVEDEGEAQKIRDLMEHELVDKSNYIVREYLQPALLTPESFAKMKIRAAKPVASMPPDCACPYCNMPVFSLQDMPEHIAAYLRVHEDVWVHPTFCLRCAQPFKWDKDEVCLQYLGNVYGVSLMRELGVRA